MDVTAVIDEISVSNLALIREAHLQFSEGLTVLTGETGAGKTALLTALKLLLGARGHARMVRQGEPFLRVEARVTRSFLQNDETSDMTSDEAVSDEVCIVARTVDAQGRSRAEVNNRMATLQHIFETCEPLIDLCGQHEHQRLLDPKTHEALLDAHAASSIADPHARYQEAYVAHQQAKKRLEDLQTRASVTQDGIDAARYVIARIDEVAPREGEYEELSSRLSQALHAQEILTSLTRAYGHLADDEGIHDELSEVMQTIEGLLSVDESLEEVYKRLDACTTELDDIAQTIHSKLDAIDLDPLMLEKLQERMRAYKTLLRNWGPEVHHVFERYKKAQVLMRRAQVSTEDITRATQEVCCAKTKLEEAARKLSSARKEAARPLSHAITQEIHTLEMPASTITFDVEDLPFAQWTKKTCNRVEIMYQPGTKLAPLPLKAIASGGEISRVMLAVKVVLGTSDDTPTLVFDEIDAGIGGVAAAATAHTLARLAKTHQVIVVTHLAQVAAYADTHILVEKHGVQAPYTTVRELTDDERVEELARMLSGEVSDVARSHAQELFLLAQREKAK